MGHTKTRSTIRVPQKPNRYRSRSRLSRLSRRRTRTATAARAVQSQLPVGMQTQNVVMGVARHEGKEKGPAAAAAVLSASRPQRVRKGVNRFKPDAVQVRALSTIRENGNADEAMGAAGAGAGGKAGAKSRAGVKPKPRVIKVTAEELAAKITAAIRDPNSTETTAELKSDLDLLLEEKKILQEQYDHVLAAIIARRDMRKAQHIADKAFVKAFGGLAVGKKNGENNNANNEND